MAKGGMCVLPFGRDVGRLDRLDDELFFDVQPGNGWEALVRMSVVDAVHLYLFGLLGRNGVTPQDFLDAYRYLFVVDEDPETWPDETGRRLTVIDKAHVNGMPGKVLSERHVRLTDSEIESMTFPAHFRMAGFSRFMAIARFRRMLMVKRRRIVQDNRPQILSCLRELKTAAAGRGEYLKSDTRSADVDLMLVEPTPEGLAAMIYPKRVAVAPVVRRVFEMPRRDSWTPRRGEGCIVSPVFSQMD